MCDVGEDHDAQAVTVAVGEPSGLVRLGLVATLRRHEALEVSGEAEDLRELLTVIEDDRPDVAVVAYDLPGLDGDIGPLREMSDALKVVVVSDDTTDTAIIRTFRSAADGFVVKDNAQELLGFAVTWVGGGGTFIDPQVAGILVALTSKGLRSYEGPFGLTVQEQRVAVLLAEGMTNREIGVQLGIAPGTVKTYVANAVEKLGARDRYEAADISEREGIDAPGT